MHLWERLPHNRLLPLLLLLLLLLLLQQCTPSRAHSDALRCQTLQSKKLVRICTGRYPQDLRYRYSDGLIDRNAWYAVFVFSDEPDHYFFSFKRSRMLECKTLNVYTTNEFGCTLDNNKKPNITVDKAMVYCLGFHYELADELIFNCLNERPKPSAFVVFQYADKRTYSLDSQRSLVALRSMTYALAFAATMLTFFWVHFL